MAKQQQTEKKIFTSALKEASELSKFNKKTKPSFKENLSEDEADETLKTKSLRNTPPSTSCFLRKRRNSVDSVRGLSTRSKASLTALKSVVADLETDFTEVKNTVSTTNDLYNGKMDVLADKIAQLENTFKVKIEFLSARVIDLETNHDSLLAENVKLKNDIQNIKQLQKGTIKRVNNLEAVTNNTTFVNAARDATPAEQPETSGKNSLPKGPFTWKEGNPPTRVTLLEGLPFSIVFPGFVYMRGRVTLGGGLPYLLTRVTLLEGTTFCLFEPCKRSR